MTSATSKSTPSSPAPAPAGPQPKAEDTWIFDHLHRVYFHPLSNTYAVPHPETGEWSYIPVSAAQFSGSGSGNGAESSRTSTIELEVGTGTTDQGIGAGTGFQEEKEEGEIEDDVGWGGLMEPDRLEEVLREKELEKDRYRHRHAHARPRNGVTTPYASAPGLSTSGGGGVPAWSTLTAGMEKHPAYTAYDDPTLYAYPSSAYAAADQSGLTETETEKETPKHILRLVVGSSKILHLQEGGVAIIDAREGGVQIGRDRCEKGGPVRLRLREMEVSKVHAVVYWGKSGGDAVGNEGEGDQGQEREGEGEEEGWWIVDLGSTHGTFLSHPPPPSSDSGPAAEAPDKLARTRLSEAKHSSRPFRLAHLSTIRIGSTTLSAHIHPSWPCELCQIKGSNEISLDNGESKADALPAAAAGGRDYNPAIAMDSKQKRENREIKRKREMALLRETMLNRNSPASASAATATGASKDGPGPDGESPAREYLDRSAMRRRLHPPSPKPSSDSNTRQSQLSSTTAIATRATPTSPAASASASAHTPTHTGSTFAASFLASQGWRGQGLGKDQTGLAEPVRAEMRTAKRGLGAEGSRAVVDSGEGDWRSRGKQRRWDEMNGRS